MLVSHFRSIIAATGLDFCVRNENRYFPSAMDTELGAVQPHYNQLDIHTDAILVQSLRISIELTGDISDEIPTNY